MKHTIAIVVAAFAVLGAASAQAVSQRTFVATYGSDGSGSCSAALPCRSFGAAAARTASGGEIVVLDSGGYGPVEVTQSVAIIAPEGIHAGISVLPGLTGIAVNGSGIDVTLRGLTIVGQDATTFGIVVQQAARVRIDRCTIANTSVGISKQDSDDLVIADTTVTHSGTGIAGANAMTTVVRSRVLNNTLGIIGFASSGPPPSFTPATGNMAVIASLAANNGGDGLGAGQWMGNSYRLLVDGAVSRGNAGAGVRSMSMNLGINNQTRAYVFDSVLDGNLDGALADTQPEGGATLNLWDNLISANSVHGAYATTSGAIAGTVIFATRNRLFDNPVGMQATNNGTIKTAGNNEVPGTTPTAGNVTVVPLALY